MWNMVCFTKSSETLIGVGYIDSDLPKNTYLKQVLAPQVYFCTYQRRVVVLVISVYSNGIAFWERNLRDQVGLRILSKCKIALVLKVPSLYHYRQHWPQCKSDNKENPTLISNSIRKCKCYFLKRLQLNTILLNEYHAIWASSIKRLEAV